MNLIIYGAVTEDEMAIERRQFIDTTLILFLIGFIIASLIALYLSKRLVSLTQIIQSALKRVQDGDLTTRIYSYREEDALFSLTNHTLDPQGNELSQIALSFNKAVERFSEMLEENKELQLTSETDHLTGLPNFRSFEQSIKEYHQFHPDQNYSIVVLDIDHFKSINDTYGHEAGNEILRQFADLLRENCQKEGEVARFGGEEFILLLPKYNKEKAVAFAELLREKIEEYHFICHDYMSIEKQTIEKNITASIGVATYRQGEKQQQKDDLISQADRAMYIGSKRNGRNKVSSFEDLKEK